MSGLSLQLSYCGELGAMTVPFERTRALFETKLFLQELMDAKVTPRVPRALRGKAKSLLKHFPTVHEIEKVHKALPEDFGPVPTYRAQVEAAAEAGRKAKQRRGFAEVVQASERMGVNDDELLNVPRKRRPNHRD